MLLSISRSLVRNLVSSSLVSASNQGYATAAATLDFRRMKQREGWISAEQKVEEEDGDYFIFPRERLGNQYPLNYAINAHKITPSGDAYRNLHSRGLVMLASGKLDAKKALVTTQVAPAIPEDKFQIFQRGDENFRNLMRDVRIYFSEAEELFVHDGDLGADPTSSLAVRLFTDNAATALWAHHMLCRVPLQDPRSRNPKLTAYVLTNLNKSSFVGIDPDAGIVVLNNVDDTTTLSRALLQLFSAFIPDFVMPDSHSLLLNASVFSPSQGKTDLLLPGSGDFDRVLPFPELASSQYTLWNSNGLTRVFDGYTQSSPPTTFHHALVESRGKASPLMTTHLKNKIGNLLPSPSRAIFLSNADGEASLTSLTPPQALDLAASQDPLLADALKTNPLPGFILNTNKATPSQVSEILRKNATVQPATAAAIKAAKK